MKFQYKYLFKKSNTFLGNEKWLQMEILQTQISLNAFHAVFSCLFWLTLHFTEPLKNKQTKSTKYVFGVYAHIYAYKNTHTCYLSICQIETVSFCCKGRHPLFYYAAGWVFERILHPAKRPELKELTSVSVLKFLLMFTYLCLSLSFLDENNKEKGILSLHILIQHKYFELYHVDNKKRSCFRLPFYIKFCQEQLHSVIVKHTA